MSSGHGRASLFGELVQPESLGLFSSTSSDPFALWTLHRDRDLEEDSGILLLVDATNQRAPTDPGGNAEGFSLRTDETVRGGCSESVLHMQSPAIRNTFIRSPPNQDTELGITLPHITFLFRAIGTSRPFALEVGIRDERGKRGVIRVSTFQTKPKLYFEPTLAKSVGAIEGTAENEELEPLLHLPLTAAPIPSQGHNTSLTAWQVLTLPLSKLARHFSDLSLIHSAERPLVSSAAFASFHCISYVQIHANLRLRRVWCSKHVPDHDLAEFQVFS